MAAKIDWHIAIPWQNQKIHPYAHKESFLPGFGRPMCFLCVKWKARSQA